MEDFQKRVIEEKEELDAKLERLSLFIKADPIFLVLSMQEQCLMKQQETLMSAYSVILAARIGCFDRINELGDEKEVDGQDDSE